MDEITQEDIRPPQTDRELTSPIDPKRLKTDCEMTNNHSGTNRFDFPEFLTFQKTNCYPSSSSMLQKYLDQGCTAGCEDIEDENSHEQQDAQLLLTPITKLITSHTDDAPTGSSKGSFITGERRFLLRVKDEQPPVIERDKLSSYPVDVAGGALAECHTSNGASSDTSSHPDCKWLRESFEDKYYGSCNLPTGNDGAQVQNNVSQIQAFTHSSSDKEVRCQFDCTHEDMLHDTGFCHSWSQSAENQENSQERDEHGFIESTLLSKEKEENTSPIPSTEYAHTELFNSNPEEDPSSHFAESTESDEKILEIQNCEKKNVAVGNGETKGQVYESGPSNSFIPSTTECVEGSIFCYDVLLDRSIAFENEADDFCGAKGELAAGKMIAKAWSETADHTTETPMPARISQEPAEGDNDAGPFSVIDPAIWSETDREAEGKRCNSESTAGAELSPSVKVCKMEMPLQLCSDVRPSQEVSALHQTWQLNHQSRTQQCKDEKVDFCQLYTEPQAFSITTNETHKAGNEGGCLWKSSPSSSPKLPPVGNARQESLDAVGCQLKEQHHLDCFSVSLDCPKTQEVEYLQTEIARMDRATEMKGREEITHFEEEMRTDEHGSSDIPMDLVEKLLLQNEKHKERSETSAGDVIIGWAAGEMKRYGNIFTHSDEQLGNNIDCLSDHPYSAVIPVIERTTEKHGRKEAGVGEEMEVQGNSEILVTSKDCHQQQSPQKGATTEVSPDDCNNEWTDDNISKTGNILSLVRHHKHGDKFSCSSDFQHKAETFMAEKKDEHLAFTFPPTSDAVVPGLHELIPLQNSENNPTGLNCSDRFSPFCNHVPVGFDTFEKILISLDDTGNDDARLSNSPLPASLPGQMWKTPQRQLNHSMPEADSSKDEEVPEEEGEEEEEVERFECHTEIMANGFLSSDYTDDEFPNFSSAADVTALSWPKQLTCNSSECFQHNLNPQSLSPSVSSTSDSPASSVSNSPKFERKKQFDMVLKELNLFFDISMSDFASDSRASSPVQCGDVTEALEEDASNCKELSCPEIGRHRDTSSGNVCYYFSYFILFIR